MMALRLAGVVLVTASAASIAMRFDQPWRVRDAATVTQTQATPDPAKDAVYICPMDADVRSRHPGTCSRCGMTLVSGIPDPVEFHLDLTVSPQPLQPQQPALLTFAVHDPWKDRPVKNFVVVHE